MELRVSEESAAVSVKENLASATFTIGKAMFIANQVVCPVWTSSALAIGEQAEIRAYKLGKQKCSYNQVELIVTDMCHGSDPQLQVSEAIETSIGAEVDDLLKESCLKFNVRFVNNKRMHLYVYVVYASPYCSMSSGKSKQAARYYWVPVTRSKCRKGCKGPVIRGLQRFGRMSRRVGNMNSLQEQEHIVNAVQNSGNRNNSFIVGDSWKEPRHLYIAIDEASTHVCPRPQTSKFRLLVAACDDQNQLVGSAVSTCIRVLANNDAPLGAASFKLVCNIKGMEKSANWLPIATSPAGSEISPEKQYGRFPLQEMSQISINPSSEVTKETDISTANVLWSEFQEATPVGDKQLCIVESPSSSCCSDETTADNSSLDNLCQRVFDACSCKQQGVIALRKFSTILGASRHSLMDIFSVLSIIKVVEEQGKEKYLWLGSNRIEDALQELLVNRKHSNVYTPMNSKAGLDMNCEIPSTSELGKRFCLLFLLNKYADIRWEYAVDTLLTKIKGKAREEIRTTLWKISVILSALHLIVSKRGPVFEWSGREGVTAHLNSLAQLRLIQRCREASYRPNKRKKIDLEKVEGDCFAGDRDELPSFCNQVQICRSLPLKRSRLSLTLPGNACDSDVRQNLQASSAIKCILTGSTDTEYRYSFAELQNRKNITTSSRTESCCQKCMEFFKTSLRMSYSEDEDRHNGKNIAIAALDQASTSRTKDVAHPCRQSSAAEQNLHFTSNQPVAACYVNSKKVNNKESQEGRLCNCSLSLLHCSVSNVKGPQPIKVKDPTEHAFRTANWQFDPLASLSNIYTLQQVITLQQHNPGFLINFVRYYRQLYHKYAPKSDALVHLPFPIRPSYSSFCLLKNLAAKVTSFTT